MKPCPACQQSETRGRPFTGAWIETINCAGYDSSSEGRPFTGAWIETPRGKRANPVKPVAPSRGRGLKQRKRRSALAADRSPLHGGVD